MCRLPSCGPAPESALLRPPGGTRRDRPARAGPPAVKPRSGSRRSATYLLSPDEIPYPNECCWRTCSPTSLGPARGQATIGGSGPSSSRMGSRRQVGGYKPCTKPGISGLVNPARRDERDGPDVQWKQRSSRGRVRRVEAGELRFVDESGATTAMAQILRRAPRGERDAGSVPAWIGTEHARGGSTRNGASPGTRGRSGPAIEGLSPPTLDRRTSSDRCRGASPAPPACSYAASTGDDRDGRRVGLTSPAGTRVGAVLRRGRRVCCCRARGTMVNIERLSGTRLVQHLLQTTPGPGDRCNDTRALLMEAETLNRD